jgi:phosphoribosylaminoimidazole carboxylase (NCAIR synthetase)
VDAVLLRPEVTQVVYGHTALLQSAAAGPRTRTVTLPVAAKVTILGYDGRGTLVDQRTVTGTTVPARVAAGGFTVLRW